MYLILFTLSLVIHANVDCAKLPLNTIRENRIMSNALNPNGERYFKPREWVKIIASPPKVLTHPMGVHVELECEAIGSPSPRIQWLKGNTPLTEDEDYESNAINTNAGIGKIKSRLVIGSALPIHEGVFSCLAESGAQTALSTTNLYVSQGVAQNFSDFLNTNMVPSVRAQVRIVLFNTARMETIGSSIILPCKSIGTPKADIFWVDNNDQLITNHNSRIKILPDGELSIENLQWSDMGSYTCLARNSFSKDTVFTFVYPMLNEN